MWFFAGLSLGLLLHRQSQKPLLRFPLRCWFMGHVRGKEVKYSSAMSDWMCSRCHYMCFTNKLDNTFWTS